MRKRARLEGSKNGVLHTYMYSCKSKLNKPYKGRRIKDGLKYERIEMMDGLKACMKIQFKMENKETRLKETLL